MNELKVDWQLRAETAEHEALILRARINQAEIDWQRRTQIVDHEVLILKAQVQVLQDTIIALCKNLPMRTDPVLKKEVE